ncbi:MAG: glutamate--tRNA ligase [Opitutaceae bacterium]|jgi:glutamyl-tRNA synthetase|nr:glutamate--tRNA ligase [Opitutaceae bacterium]
MASPVRVRFAPSPTGFFHIGSARTALFNWLYARHTGGRFILRVEDTDAARNSEAFLNVIYDSLRWLGLDWDEGPGVGGPFGPYRQSERAPIYKTHLQKLLDAGRAYERDGALWFKLDGERREVFDERRQKNVIKVARPPAVINDAIRGRVERLEDEDFVIARSDGSPVFHFVNVVDDIEMRITHVIRGEDHLSNTSKHVELFKALGAPVPVFAHIPLILKQNGPGKMSKRDQGALVEEYQRRGFLPEALVNFLALLGWNPGNDLEKMPLAEIVARFDLPGVNQSNARFDERKLAHMNMEYTLALPPESFVRKAAAFFASNNLPPPTDTPALFDAVMRLCQPKIKSLGDLPDYTRYFFTDNFPVDEKARAKVLSKGDPAARLRELLDALQNADFSSDAAIETAIKQLAESRGLGFGDYQAVARLAVSGSNAGPNLTGLFRVLGRPRVLARLARFLETL